MKVVIDTNVLLVIIPSLSRYHLAYEALKQNRYDVAVSNEILLEYEEQLSLRYDISDASEILQNLLENQNIQL
jgi:predicted nucleic acid-binding protein